MSIDDHPNDRRVGSAEPTLTGLELALTTLVARLEREVALHGTVSESDVCTLHELRDRSEWFFRTRDHGLP